MLTGKATLHLHWAERIMALCDLRLVITVESSDLNRPQERL